MSLFFPLTDRQDAAPPTPEGATRVPLRVLLVEDCEDDVALILRLLRASFRRSSTSTST